MCTFYEKIAYTTVLLLFVFWLSILFVINDRHFFGYITSQVVIYFLIVVTLFKRHLMSILQVFFIVYKIGTTLYGMSLVKSMFQSNWSMLFKSWYWENSSFIEKVVTIDVIIHLTIIILCIGICGLMTVGTFLIAITSPCVNYEYLFKKFRKPKIDMKKCFKKCNVYENDDICCICLAEYDNTTLESKTCGHMFHSYCITEWVKMDNFECPLCKKKFDKSNDIIDIL